MPTMGKDEITNGSNITYREVRLLQAFIDAPSQNVFVHGNYPKMKTLRLQKLIACETLGQYPGRWYITPLGEQVLERAKQVGLNDHFYGVRFPFP